MFFYFMSAMYCLNKYLILIHKHRNNRNQNILNIAIDIALEILEMQWHIKKKINTQVNPYTYVHTHIGT